jgi:hypothetical protein
MTLAMTHAIAPAKKLSGATLLLAFGTVAKDIIYFDRPSKSSGHSRSRIGSSFNPPTSL